MLSRLIFGYQFVSILYAFGYQVRHQHRIKIFQKTVRYAIKNVISNITFHIFILCSLWYQFGFQNRSKINPKRDQKSDAKGNTSQDDFGSHFDPNMAPKWAQDGGQKGEEWRWSGWSFWGVPAKIREKRPGPIDPAHFHFILGHLGAMLAVFPNKKCWPQLSTLGWSPVS